MSVVSGAFNITAIIDGVNGDNGMSYSIRTNVETWHMSGGGTSPSHLTWSFVVSDGKEITCIESLVDAYAVGLSPKYKVDDGEITDVQGSFSIRLLGHYRSVTIYLYKGDTIVAEKNIRITYGVLSVEQQYYLSSSRSELIGGSWSSTPPTAIAGMYVWVRTYTTYTDGTSSATEGVCLTNEYAINKLINGEVEVSSDTAIMATYRPLAPLVEGKKYRIAICATLAEGVNKFSVRLSNGSTKLTTFTSNGSQEPQTFMAEITVAYSIGHTAEDDISNADIILYRENGTGKSTIHWARVDVGLVREQKMYALATSRSHTPTSGWQTTVPVAVGGTYVWQKTIQYFDDGTQADTGVMCLQGASGAKMRMRDWAIDTEYLEGASGEEYYDLVLYGNNQYLCVVSHTSSSEILPTDTNYWRMATDWLFIATRVMLARNAQIDLLEGNDIMAKDSEGNVTAGMSGGDDGIRFWAGATQENKATAPFLVNEQGESWLKNAHVSGEVNATSGVFKDVKIESGTIGGFTIEKGTLRTSTLGSGRIIIEPGINKFIRINDDELSPLFYARNDSGVIMQLNAYGNNATALELLCNSSGSGVALRSTGDAYLVGRYSSVPSVSPHEKIMIAGLSVSCKKGSSFTSPTNVSPSTAWVDFLIANGDITLPSAKNCAGKVLFVKAKGVISCQETNGGIVLADGTTIQVAKDRGNRAMIYISDGNSWYEFYCG